MRRIPLTTRPVVDGSPFPGTVIDSAIIKQVVTIADPQRGMDLEEMRQGLKVLDALDKVNGSGELVLEDAQWTFLCNRLQSFRWAVGDPRFLELADTVLRAPVATP